MALRAKQSRRHRHESMVLSGGYSYPETRLSRPPGGPAGVPEGAWLTPRGQGHSVSRGSGVGSGESTYTGYRPLSDSFVPLVYPGTQPAMLPPPSTSGGSEVSSAASSAVASRRGAVRTELPG